MTQTPVLPLPVCGEVVRAWASQEVWRVLATRFDQALDFLTTWQAWTTDPQRPRRLHYVALASKPPALDELLASAARFPELLRLVTRLEPHWVGLGSGFHRITLEDGGVLLTLCVGKLTGLLRDQQFLADSVFLDPEPSGPDVDASWDLWTVKALARCCRRGALVNATANAGFLRADLQQCGFEMQAHQDSALNDQRGGFNGQFNPLWALRGTRATSGAVPVLPGRCAVIGAGLAGASVASALAARGWTVQVLDQGNAPAAGASGLPAGLVVPHFSADDCALSRLSRSGVRQMLHEARVRLREGQDWAPSGTRERQLQGGANLPDIWHAQAAWLKPATMVRAWLNQPGVTFIGHARVAALRRSADQWELLDALGQVLARTDRVVLANACGAIALIDDLRKTRPTDGSAIHRVLAMQGVRGQLSWAMHPVEPDAAFPACPVNGAGSVIPVVPLGDGPRAGNAWFIGSSYEPETQPASSEDKNHASNFERLRQLLPDLGQLLAAQFAQGDVQAWKGVRCVTTDRLPTVGPLGEGDHASLWICAGMGSRGLTLAVLCAELLAASWGAEPLPISARLAQSLSVTRGRTAVAA